MALKARIALRIGLAVVAVGALAWSQIHHDGKATTASAQATSA